MLICTPDTCSSRTINNYLLLCTGFYYDFYYVQHCPVLNGVHNAVCLLACRAFSIVLSPVDRNSTFLSNFQVHSRGLDDLVRKVIAFVGLYLEVLISKCLGLWSTT